MDNNVINLFCWEVYEFNWGTAVKEKRTGKWNKIFIKPGGQEIDVERLSVIIHDNGIEFLN